MCSSALEFFNIRETPDKVILLGSPCLPWLVDQWTLSLSFMSVFYCISNAAVAIHSYVLLYKECCNCNPFKYLTTKDVRNAQTAGHVEWAYGAYGSQV